MLGLNTQKKLENLKFIYETCGDFYPNFDQRFITECNPYIKDELSLNNSNKSYTLFNLNNIQKPVYFNNFNYFDNFNICSNFSPKNYLFFNNLANSNINTQLNISNFDISLGLKKFIDDKTNF